jgi:hypothetical protein
VLTEARRHKDVWGSKGIDPPFLTSTPDGGGWSASRPGPVTPLHPTGTHCTGGWEGQGCGTDAVEGRKISRRESNPDPSAIQPVIRRNTGSAILPAFSTNNGNQNRHTACPAEHTGISFREVAYSGCDTVNEVLDTMYLG